MAETNSSKEGSFISEAAISDQPSVDDELGFEKYVNAVKEFLIHPNTEPPLTLSVEGEWGSGKSSFLLQLEESLKQEENLTVQFNPWRHEKESELWAAFALEFLHQIRTQISYRRRFIGSVKLAKRRFTWKNNRMELIRSVGVLLLVILLPFIAVIIGSEWAAPHLIALVELSGYSNIVKAIVGTSGFAVTFVAISTLGKRSLNSLFHPLEFEIERYIERPEYHNQISFLTNFHKDLNRILNSYVGDQTVFVFIDDLDRCEVPKAAELMQSINLMMSDDPRLAVIIGMDREKVAAGIAAKHEEILPYISPQNEASPIEGEKTPHGSNYGLQFGYQYLEKFIQIPIQIPKPKPEDVGSLLSTITGTEPTLRTILRLETNLGINPDPFLHGSQAGSGTRSNEIDGDALKLLNQHSDPFQETMIMVMPALKNNPRQIKRFMNLFRLRTLLAVEDGLFVFDEEGQLAENSLTLQQLGKFVAISLRWPRLLPNLETDGDLLAQLERVAIEDGVDEEDIGRMAEFWAQQEELLTLLGWGVESERSWQYSLAEIQIESLLQISPRTDLPTAREDLKKEAEKVYQKFKDGETLDTEDLMKLQRAGLL